MAQAAVVGRVIVQAPEVLSQHAPTQGFTVQVEPEPKKYAPEPVAQLSGIVSEQMPAVEQQAPMQE